MLKNILERMRGKSSPEETIPQYAPEGRVDTLILDLVKGGKAEPVDATLLPDCISRF